MSTRSYIVRKTDEGVYCHWDGYPDYNGVILADSYSDDEKLRAIRQTSGLRRRSGYELPDGQWRWRSRIAGLLECN